MLPSVQQLRTWKTHDGFSNKYIILFQLFLFHCFTKMDTSQLYSTTTSGPTMGDPNQGSTSSNTTNNRRRRSREIETLSLEIRNYPRDLLHSFISTNPNTSNQQSIESAMEEHGAEDEEPELHLGLSLGGRFGVDKSHRGLTRASSIAGEIPCLRDGEEEEMVAPDTEKAAALARTSSLPTVTEEEWRRRKATLRRMEAKRRRSEKQRSLKENSVGGGAGEERESGSGLNFRGRLEREQHHLGVPGKLNTGPGHGLPGHKGGNTSTGSSSRQGGFFRSLQGLLTHQQQQQQHQLQNCSQGSGESQGGSSSGASELESKIQQGSSSHSESKSPGSNQSMQMQDRCSHDLLPMGSSSSVKQAEPSDPKKKEAAANKVEDMPSVFTIGDGPNGRKVEGILYKYGKGEEVRIMCICHGNFFSPVEFVKHAGGRDVVHPLRHIVVNPSSSPF